MPETSHPDVPPANIFEALARAQSEFPTIKKSKTAEVYSKRTNAKYTYQYAPFDEMLEAVRGPLNRHGLYLWHEITTEKMERPSPASHDLQYDAALAVQFVEAVLVYRDGAELRSGKLPIPDFFGDMQAMGSGLSYGRRYTTQSLLGICPEDDDDAQRTPGGNPFRQGDSQPTGDGGSQRGQKRGGARSPQERAAKRVEAEEQKKAAMGQAAGGAPSAGDKKPPAGSVSDDQVLAFFLEKIPTKTRAVDFHTFAGKALDNERANESPQLMLAIIGAMTRHLESKEKTWTTDEVSQIRDELDNARVVFEGRIAPPESTEPQQRGELV